MKRGSKEYLAFVNREADEFVMRNMPSGDISEAKHFVPMFDGGIAGYYKITGITFGSRKQPLLDDDANPILDANGKEIKVTLTLNSKDRVTKIVAETVDDDDDEDKPKEGYLKSVKTSGNGKITITETTKSSAKEYTWNLDSDVNIQYSINDDASYDGDYKNTLKGLDNFRDACEDNNENCYITLKTNSEGDVTKITASDHR